MKTTTIHIALFCCIAIYNISSAQNSHFSVGSSLTMAETGTAEQNSFSVFNNPATLDSATIGISAKQFYLLDGLNAFTVSGSKEMNFATIGAGLHYFGDELYNETVATLALSKSLTKNIQIGASVNYFSAQAVYANQAATAFPQLGISYQLNESFTLASSIRNPLSQDLNDPFQQQLQSHISFGGRYMISENTITNFQADLLENDGFSSAIAVDYQAFENFAFQLGGRLHPGLLTAGVTLTLTDFNTTIGSQYQDMLGFSPVIAMEKGF